MRNITATLPNTPMHGSRAAPFSPTDIAGLQAWYDADDASTLTLNTTQSAFIGPTGLNCVDVSGNQCTTPHSAAIDMTGDFELIAKCAYADWTPATQQVVICKGGGSGANDNYVLRLKPGGDFELVVRNASDTGYVGYSSAATGVADGATKWVRVTLDCSTANGTAKYYLSDDGSTWVQLGSDVTGSGALGGSHSASGAGVELGIGCYPTGGYIQKFIGTIHRAIVKNGIDGTVVFDADFVAATDYATSFTESSSNGATVTVTSSTSGLAPISQWNDKSVNGYHMTQGTAINQPRYGSTINGLRSLRFATGMEGNIGNSSLPSLGVPLTHFLVAKIPSADTQFILLSSKAGNGNFLGCAQSGDSNTGVNNAGSPTIHINGSLSSPATRGVFYTTAAVGVAYIFRLVGTFNVHSGLSIGYSSTGFQLSDNSEVAELISVASPSAGDITQIETYLKTKWGTP